ncbi:hypothetical protein BC941DRAFT_180705 [Chlamydoabsidia padenii]|nr:hypothetical protein BC941DRAFT_180705 [Chlamydoabsidia padenii]
MYGRCMYIWRRNRLGIMGIHCYNETTFAMSRLQSPNDIHLYHLSDFIHWKEIIYFFVNASHSSTDIMWILSWDRGQRERKLIGYNVKLVDLPFIQSTGIFMMIE